MWNMWKIAVSPLKYSTAIIGCLLQQIKHVHSWQNNVIVNNVNSVFIRFFYLIDFGAIFAILIDDF